MFFEDGNHTILKALAPLHIAVLNKSHENFLLLFLQNIDFKNKTSYGRRKKHLNNLFRRTSTIKKAANKEIDSTMELKKSSLFIQEHYIIQRFVKVIQNLLLHQFLQFVTDILEIFIGESLNGKRKRLKNRNYNGRPFFLEDLNGLESIRIPRWIGLNECKGTKCMSSAMQVKTYTAR